MYVCLYMSRFVKLPSYFKHALFVISQPRLQGSVKRELRTQQKLEQIKTRLPSCWNPIPATSGHTEALSHH